jgi:hypothetical protein
MESEYCKLAAMRTRGVMFLLTYTHAWRIAHFISIRSFDSESTIIAHTLLVILLLNNIGSKSKINKRKSEKAEQQESACKKLA